jgi:hypothetical protein
MFGKLSFAVLLFSLAAVFTSDSFVDAAKSPKITSKVYFDIEHGGEKLGRGMIVLFILPLTAHNTTQLSWGFMVAQFLRPLRTSALSLPAYARMVHLLRRGWDTKVANSTVSSRTSCMFFSVDILAYGS